MKNAIKNSAFRTSKSIEEAKVIIANMRNTMKEMDVSIRHLDKFRSNICNNLNTNN